jgi:hypothetical protein
MLVASVCFLASSLPVAAHEGPVPGQFKERNAQRAGMNVSVGTGLGNQYSLAGLSASGSLRTKSGLGVSLSSGLGPVASWGLQAWTPGGKIRGGLGLSVGYTWDELGGESDIPMTYCSQPTTSVVEDGSRRRHVAPRPDPVTPSVFGLDLLVDHDIGQARGWNMRYGLGSTAMVGGCAGVVIPMPSVGLSYIF